MLAAPVPVAEVVQITKPTSPLTAIWTDGLSTTLAYGVLLHPCSLNSLTGSCIIRCGPIWSGIVLNWSAGAVISHTHLGTFHIPITFTRAVIDMMSDVAKS